MQQRIRKRTGKSFKKYPRLLLLVLALIICFLAGYLSRKLLLAYGSQPPVITDPVEEPGEGDENDHSGPSGPNVEPDPNVELDPGNEPDPGDEPGPGSDPGEEPDPPDPVEILEIADGDYLLALVGKKTSLGRYAPADLVRVPPEMKFHDYPYELREEAYSYLRVMWEDARAEGLNLTICSAYRSYETQRAIFNDHVARRGEEEANRFSARPGQSEHQLGTTVDFAVPGAYLSESFAGTPEGIWLAENAHKYGFALSYPKGSEEITGYIYEPWHYRYIGVEEAAQWKASGELLYQFLERFPQQWLTKP